MMIVIGHRALKYKRFMKVDSFEDIKNSSSDCMVWFDKSGDKSYMLSHHCSENAIEYAVSIQNITDFVLYSNLYPKYIIIEKAPEIYQKIAEDYMLDCKILYIINKEEEIGEIAKIGIDGVIFRDVLEDGQA